MKNQKESHIFFFKLKRPSLKGHCQFWVYIFSHQITIIYNALKALKYCYLIVWWDFSFKFNKIFLFTRLSTTVNALGHIIVDLFFFFHSKSGEFWFLIRGCIIAKITSSRLNFGIWRIWQVPFKERSQHRKQWPN